MYCLTPYKCGVFRIIYLQINHLVDVANATGKGANTVISLLHHFFEIPGMGESCVHLHADNCCGQNKNWHVIAYFNLRVLTSLHKGITFSLVIAGHIKFAPDTCLALPKESYGELILGAFKIFQLQCQYSHPQLVNGTRDVPVYDWGSLHQIL